MYQVELAEIKIKIRKSRNQVSGRGTGPPAEGSCYPVISLRSGYHL